MATATPTTPTESPEGITITDVGPNKRVEIPIVPEGGVVVLRGRNDIGKSEALKAVGALAGRKEKLSVRSDAPLGSKGHVIGGGVELSVTGSTRRKGQAEFEVLDGRLSMADLVDPGMKDDTAADVRRIKALLSLADASTDVTPFYDLVGGREAFESLLPPDARENADLVTIAAKFKRAVEAKAREAESQRDLFRGKVRGIRESVGEIDTSVTSDPGELQKALEEALTHDAGLQNQRLTSEAAAKQADEAREKLEVAKRENESLTVEEAQRLLEVRRDERSEAQDRVEELKTQLQQAEVDYRCAESAFASAETALMESEQHDKLITMWRETIDAAGNVPNPTDEQLTESDAQVVAAREALEQGALIRQAQSQLQQAKEHEEQAVEHQAVALQLREAAKGTDEVLTEIVATLGCPLLVRGGRLVVERDGREKFFGDLSSGARWKLALDIGIDAVGAGGLLPIPQEAWEGLDPLNRQAIAEHVRGRQVNIITAECSDSTVVEAEVFEGATSEA